MVDGSAAIGRPAIKQLARVHYAPAAMTAWGFWQIATDTAERRPSWGIVLIGLLFAGAGIPAMIAGMTRLRLATGRTVTVALGWLLVPGVVVSLLTLPADAGWTPESWGELGDALTFQAGMTTAIMVLLAAVGTTTPGRFGTADREGAPDP